MMLSSEKKLLKAEIQLTSTEATSAIPYKVMI
jgi:hypothetical protein